MMYVGLMTALVIKHFICDWLLQTEWMAKNKGDNMLALFLHGLVNGVGTFMVLAFVGFHAAILGLILDTGSHMSMDRLKTSVNKEMKLDASQSPYWILIGFDQMVHMVMQLVILIVVI